MPTQTLLADLCFAEGPRWHNNELFFSDMHDHKVWATDLAGNKRLIAEVPEQPSGLGWLPDGSLLVVSMLDRKLLRLEGSELKTFCDLGDLASYHCNDMVVDAMGRSYVGNFGFDIFTGEDPKTAELILVSSDGVARVVADDLLFPNGTVITPDGKTLIVGESGAGKLTAFDIKDDGSLENRRLWAQLENAIPDGICLDAEMGIWVASPTSNEALRVLEGGEVTQRVKVENQAFACMLGGNEKKTLFILTASTSTPEECRANRDGKIEFVEVSVPGAGLP